MKKLLLVTRGGDCPGSNAVIRSIMKSAENTVACDVYGSLEAFEGMLSDCPSG